MNEVFTQYSLEISTIKSQNIDQSAINYATYDLHETSSYCVNCHREIIAQGYSTYKKLTELICSFCYHEVIKLRK